MNVIMMEKLIHLILKYSWMEKFHIDATPCIGSATGHAILHAYTLFHCVFHVSRILLCSNFKKKND